MPPVRSLVRSRTAHTHRSPFAVPFTAAPAFHTCVCRDVWFARLTALRLCIPDLLRIFTFGLPARLLDVLAHAARSLVTVRLRVLPYLRLPDFTRCFRGVLTTAAFYRWLRSHAHTHRARAADAAATFAHTHTFGSVYHFATTFLYSSYGRLLQRYRCRALPHLRAVAGLSMISHLYSLYIISLSLLLY